MGTWFPCSKHSASPEWFMILELGAKRRNFEKKACSSGWWKIDNETVVRVRRSWEFFPLDRTWTEHYAMKPVAFALTSCFRQDWSCRVLRTSPGIVNICWGGMWQGKTAKSERFSDSCALPLINSLSRLKSMDLTSDGNFHVLLGRSALMSYFNIYGLISNNSLPRGRPSKIACDGENSQKLR